MDTLLDAYNWPIKSGVLQDVVGVSPDVQGGRLGVRLLRSVLTLGAIHLLRFGFAVGTAQVGTTPLNPTYFLQQTYTPAPALSRGQCIVAVVASAFALNKFTF